MDGKVIDKKNYSLEAGSTIVTLHNLYLETLSEGNHSIAVVYGDKEAGASFKVRSAPASGGGNTGRNTVVSTGDNIRIFLWLALALISMGGIAVTGIIRKKRNK